MDHKDEAREYFNKLKIVEKYCSGDIETAKKIMKGEYADIVVIKGRFKDGDEKNFGLFVIFISRITHAVVATRSVISPAESVFQHKPFDTWKNFMNKIEKEVSEGDVDPEKIKTLDAVLGRLAELKFYGSIIDWIDKNDIMNLTDKFEKIVNNVLGIDDSHAVLDFENITSLALYDEKGIKPA